MTSVAKSPLQLDLDSRWADFTALPPSKESIQTDGSYPLRQTGSGGHREAAPAQSS